MLPASGAPHESERAMQRKYSSRRTSLASLVAASFCSVCWMRGRNTDITRSIRARGSAVRRAEGSAGALVGLEGEPPITPFRSAFLRFGGFDVRLGFGAAAMGEVYAQETTQRAPKCSVIPSESSRWNQSDGRETHRMQGCTGLYFFVPTLSAVFQAQGSSRTLVRFGTSDGSE